MDTNFIIPECFKAEGENYITLPVIKLFAKEKELGPIMSRAEGLESIIEFANSSKSSREDTLNWLDKVLKEGIKDIYLDCVTPDKNFPDDEKILGEYLQSKLDFPQNAHICGNAYNGLISFVKYQFSKNNDTTIISLYFCTKLHCHDIYNHTSTVTFPIVVDYLKESQILVGRAKSKSNLFEYMPSGFNIDSARTTKAEKLIDKAINKSLELLHLQKNETALTFKNNIFKLLDKYTHTPKDIQEILGSHVSDIEELAKILMDRLGLDPRGKNALQRDLLNLTEKYLSIYWPNKNIFISDRDAYPTKLCATDQEESKVSQTTREENEPLQSKAVFFDNKKMLYENKLCDSVLFHWKRINRLYFDEHFKVGIQIKRKKCLVKFFDYTKEEDIQNVLFSIVKS